MPPFLRDAIHHVLRIRPSIAAAVAVLALGIGAGAAAFAMFNTALLQRLPYPHADRLVQVWGTDRQQDILEESLSYDDYRLISERTSTLDKVAFYALWEPTATAKGQRIQVTVARISENLFEVLGVTPSIGSALPPGPDAFVVLSNDAALRLFGSADDLPDSVVLLNGEPYTPIGVMPSGFAFPPNVDAWVAAENRPPRGRAARDGFVLGRLAQQTPFEQAATELATVGASLGRADSSWTVERGLRAVPLLEQVSSTIRDVVVLIFAAVAFLFMIACASAGQLVYVENLRRRREWAVRRSLGSTSRVILAQLTVEAILIAALATAAGALVALWLIGVMRGLIPPSVPRLPAVTLDHQVLLFMIALGAGSAAGVGLISAGRVMRDNLLEGLRDAPASAGTSRSAFRSTLLCAGTAGVVVLTVAAVSLASGLWRLTRADLGFDPSGVFTSRVCAPPVPQPATTAAFGPVLSDLEQFTAFHSVAMSDQLPTGGEATYEIFIDGIDGYPEVGVQYVSGSYFETLGIPLLEGSTFNDAEPAHRAAVVNRAFRDRFWPGASPLGRRFMAALGDEPEWIPVVGMADNTRRSASGDPNRPRIYFPYFQQSHSCGSLLVKSDRTLSAGLIRNVLWARIVGYSVSDVASLDTLLDDRIWQPRLRAAVTGAFAALALVFGAAALYATLSQLVSIRRRDLAIRAALGARRGDLMRVVLSTYALPIVLGFLVGLVVSYVLIGLIGTSVYGLEPLDITTVTLVVSILALSAVAATALPAWRAEQVDVLPALKRI